MHDHDLAPKATKHDFGTCGGSFRLSHDPAVLFSAWNPKSGIERKWTRMSGARDDRSQFTVSLQSVKRVLHCFGG
jgi:hypothetical protein